MELIKPAAAIFSAYILGSVPSGLLIGKYGWKVDPRAHGSGNIGFTNVWRVVGLPAAALVLLADAGKGAAAVLLAGFLFGGAPTALTIARQPRLADAAVVALAALVALLGNNYSVFLRFRGGKGVGIASGIILALEPMIAAALFIIWLTVVALTRYVSLASLIIAVLFPILMFYFQPHNPAYIVFAITAAAVVFVRHRANIGRLMSGTELKVGRDEPGSDV